MSHIKLPNNHINALVNLAIMGPAEGSTPAHPWTPLVYAPDTYTNTSLPYDRFPNDYRRVTPTTAESVGHKLADMNIGIESGFDWSPRATRATAIEGMKLIRCYEYQCMDTYGWLESEARLFCEALREALVPYLAGYEDAPWVWRS